jgi:hypothetical protein
MQENASSPRAGRANLVSRERKATEKVASIITHRPQFVAIDGDRVTIHWVFDFTHEDGRKRHIDEVTIQIWQGDLIARERFFYDSATAGWT